MVKRIHYVLIQDEREADVQPGADPLGDLTAKIGLPGLLFSQGLLASGAKPLEGIGEPDADTRDQRQRQASCGELLQQNDAGNGKENVGAPHAKHRRQLALAGECHTDRRQEIVAEDQQDSQHEAGRLSAALGREPERHPDKHQNEAGARIREALVQLDGVLPHRLLVRRSGDLVP